MSPASSSNQPPRNAFWVFFFVMRLIMSLRQRLADATRERDSLRAALEDTRRRVMIHFHQLDGSLFSHSSSFPLNSVTIGDIRQELAAVYEWPLHIVGLGRMVPPGDFLALNNDAATLRDLGIDEPSLHLYVFVPEQFVQFEEEDNDSGCEDGDDDDGDAEGDDHRDAEDMN